MIMMAQMLFDFHSVHVVLLICEVVGGTDQLEDSVDGVDMGSN